MQLMAMHTAPFATPDKSRSGSLIKFDEFGNLGHEHEDEQDPHLSESTDNVSVAHGIEMDELGSLEHAHQEAHKTHV